MLETAEGFGQMIREARRAQGLRQRELARVSGVGERFIVELEAGKPTCQLGKALRVAAVLRLDLAAQPGALPGGAEDFVVPKFDARPIPVEEP